MIRRVIALDAGEDVVGAELAVIDRHAGLRMAAHETDPRRRPRHQKFRQGARQQPGIEIVRRPVDVDIAARKHRPDQRRAVRRRRLEKLVDIAILGAAQHRQRAAIGEIFGIERAAMRRVEDERQRVRRAGRGATAHPGFPNLLRCSACRSRSVVNAGRGRSPGAERYRGRAAAFFIAQGRLGWKGERVAGVLDHPRRDASAKRRASTLPLRRRHETGEAEEFLGVLRFAVDQHLVMHMRAGGAAGAAEEADLAVRRDALPDRDGLAMEMRRNGSRCRCRGRSRRSCRNRRDSRKRSPRPPPSHRPATCRAPGNQARYDTPSGR